MTTTPPPLVNAPLMAVVKDYPTADVEGEDAWDGDLVCFVIYRQLRARVRL